MQIERVEAAFLKGNEDTVGTLYVFHYTDYLLCILPQFVAETTIRLLFIF